MPVFDFVAWVCLQFSQVSPRCPKWPAFDSVAWVPLLQNQKSDGSYCYRIKNLNSTSDFPLQNQKSIHVGQKGFQGNYPLQNQIHSLLPSLIPSYHLSPLHNQDLKIWHWGACFTRNSKTLGCRKPYLYKISSMTKMWGFVHFLLRVGVPIYRIMDLLRYSPNMSKMDGFCVLASPGFCFCSKVGVQDGSPESKVFGVPTPLIL